ncbi:RuBisCO large subunit C-terminal-like domain-containing protein [Rubellimicrobium sp. CFH 75288]|uniref:RuBisCO large subunit C-terminal-like domain-containing protein n=1 Tax=Rubellimicrobium sp. CFH 75288 TaxID=2697034 RepID=UPI0014125DAE|nr:RuBisCO large subunit C-terminal-like domain-containing protein [Rubellimicrobium sp. CFH 75288]NAZ35994.1 ribulose 1,5-bisphosphate carboxylase [Rubellimicrobium sp. CFH 75288]
MDRDPARQRIRARYLIETGVDVAEAAAVMAGEQSSGTFVAVEGETPELKARAGAQVERIEERGEVPAPSLPGARREAGRPIRRAEVELSWPLGNLGPSLPNLVTTVGGNLFELGQFSGLRILDIELPPAFFARYPGPRHGPDGTRALTGVRHGPILGTIVKPSVGLGPAEVADLVRRLGEAGLDFVKDDELQADGPICPFEDRVAAVMRAVRDLEDRRGRRLMYAFNLTGEIDEMRRRADAVERAGGTCVMVVLNAAGLSGFIDLARHTPLAVHAHRAGWGALSRHPLLGWSYVAWQKIWRLAGADHMHVNGLRNKFCEDDDSVMESARECLRPMSADRPCLAMPVFSSGQTVRQVPDTLRRLGSDDLMYLTGGGIMGHPHGPEAGVAALRAAWEAAAAGEPQEVRAARDPALAAALGAFGA